MPNVRPLDDEEFAEIQVYAGKSAAFLGLTMDAPAKDIVTAINGLLCEIEDDGRERPDELTVMGLGLLLGFQYTRAYDWSWGFVTWNEGYEAHAVTPPDHALAITPIQWVNWISKKNLTTNVLLNFNMVAVGDVPDSEPESFLLFQ